MLLWTILLAVTALSNGLDETILWKIPKPMKGFQWQQHLGRWYNQFRKASCSWSGSNEFTDYEVFFSRESKQTVLSTLTMRNDICNTIVNRAILRSPEAIVTAKDTIGGGYGGIYVQVAGHPKVFGISYGCTKISVLGDKCDDASITVRTRMRFPDKKVISMINDALMQLWGITVNDLQQIKHIEPCFQQKPSVQMYNKWW